MIWIELGNHLAQTLEVHLTHPFPHTHLFINARPFNHSILRAFHFYLPLYFLYYATVKGIAWTIAEASSRLNYAWIFPSPIDSARDCLDCVLLWLHILTSSLLRRGNIQTSQLGLPQCDISLPPILCGTEVVQTKSDHLSSFIYLIVATMPGIAVSKIFPLQGAAPMPATAHHLPSSNSKNFCASELCVCPSLLAHAMHCCVHAVFPQAHEKGLCLSHLGLPSAQTRYLQGIGNQISVCLMNKSYIIKM